MLQVLILISMVAGIALIVFSVFVLKSEGEKVDYNAENILEAIDKSIGDVDSAMEEFSNLSESVFEELSRKYQELLYLYSLVNGKKEALDTSSIDITAGPEGDYDDGLDDPIVAPVGKKVTMGLDALPKSGMERSRHDDIYKLYNQGMDADEIARVLDMGKGEVKLILELGKVRA